MNKKLLFLIIILIIIAVVFLYFKSIGSNQVRAGAGDNVSGWAWSENIGWISFNCTDQGSCASVDYGLDIDPVTGIFSGFAWSRGATEDGGVGWITFNEAGTAPGADLTGCPAGLCRAWLDTITGDIRGWARVLAPVGDSEAGDWDGWISLNCLNTASCASVNYGVFYVDSGATAKLDGFAWGGDDDGNDYGVIGWINFSDAVYEVVMPTDLVNVPPSATLDLVTPQTYCSSPKEAFSWNFNDIEDPLQTSYYLQVKKQTSPAWGSWVVGNGEYDSTKIDSTTEDVLLSVTTGSTVGKLDYNTGYQWRLKVWDSGGLDSGWIDGVNFSTEDHMYPTVVINPTPIRASVDEWIMMNDTSECYTISGSSYDCYTGGGIISYQWDYSYENPPGLQVDSTYKTSVGETNASTTYATFGIYAIKLRIIDSTISGAVCDSDGKTIYIGPRLPDWREIAP